MSPPKHVAYGSVPVTWHVLLPPTGPALQPSPATCMEMPRLPLFWPWLGSIIISALVFDLKRKSFFALINFFPYMIFVLIVALFFVWLKWQTWSSTKPHDLNSSGDAAQLTCLKAKLSWERGWKKAVACVHWFFLHLMTSNEGYVDEGYFSIAFLSESRKWVMVLWIFPFVKLETW